MVGAERAFVDRKRALVQRSGLVVLPGRMPHVRQALQAGGDLRVIGAVHLLGDRKPAFGRPRGADVVTEPQPHARQVGQHPCDIGMIGAQRSLGDRQRALVQHRSLRRPIICRRGERRGTTGG